MSLSALIIPTSLTIALQPCSLGNFADYLVCEEENAETLQFFLWFCDYVVRWSELSPPEKQQSPPWRPEDPWGAVDKDGRSGSPITLQTHRRERSKRLNQILEILDGKNVEDNVEQISDRRSYRFTSNPWNFSKPRRTQSVAQGRSGGDPGRSKQTSPEEDEAERREYFSRLAFLPSYGRLTHAQARDNLSGTRFHKSSDTTSAPTRRGDCKFLTRSWLSASWPQRRPHTRRPCSLPL